MAKDKKDASTLSSKTKENKLRKLTKHVKSYKHYNSDKQAKDRLEAIEKGGAQFAVRKKPNNKGGWVNSALNNPKLKSNDANHLKNKLRPELRKKGLMDMAKALKVKA